MARKPGVNTEPPMAMFGQELLDLVDRQHLAVRADLLVEQRRGLDHRVKAEVVADVAGDAAAAQQGRRCAPRRSRRRSSRRG